MEALHVDIVKNQLSSGYSDLVARLYLAGDEGHEEVAVSWRENPQRWHDFLEEPILVNGSGSMIYARKNPREYLERLHEKLSNTYMYATELHSGDECPFKEGWIAMEHIEYHADPARGPAPSR